MSTTGSGVETVSLRKRLSLAVVALLGVAVAILPAVAGSETTPEIGAVNGTGIYEEQTHSWSPSHVSVAQGTPITIANPTAVAHGVRWIAPPATPACSGGVPVGTSEAASGTQWTGTCTFARAGTYSFYWTVHGAAMSGTVTVAAGGAPVPPPSQPGAGTAPPGAGSGTTEPGPSSALPAGGGSPFLGSSAHALRVSGSQHGTSVHGSVDISQAGAGGRLEVDLLARAASLSRSGGQQPMRVGRLQRGSLVAGVVRFASSSTHADAPR